MFSVATRVERYGLRDLPKSRKVASFKAVASRFLGFYSGFFAQQGKFHGD